MRPTNITHKLIQQNVHTILVHWLKNLPRLSVQSFLNTVLNYEMLVYKAKCVKTRCLQEWVGHLEPKFQGEGVVPGEYFLVSTKLDTF